MPAHHSQSDSPAGRKQLTALAILPNRSLAQQFLGALPESRAFHIAAEWTSYPTAAKLEAQLRDGRPQVVLLDVSANLPQATALIEAVASGAFPVPVIALHVANDAGALLECLRAGAAEFLYAPFTAEQQCETVTRIASLFPGEDRTEARRGRLVTFASAKPGSGASTLAAHTALALHEVTGQRILLVDFALSSGTMRLLFKLPETPSLAEALHAVEANTLRATPESWVPLIQRKGGVDVLPSPGGLSVGYPDPSKLRKILECARPVYDWVIVDLPTVFERLSLLILPESEYGFLVTTPELPSLHLTRKAVSLLAQIGLSLENFHVIVNRAGRADHVTLEAMAKIFRAPVYATFTNDYLSLHKALSAGQPIGPCALERALREFAQTICSQPRRAEAPAAELSVETAV
ncbi:MAG TPA: cellulose synthase operon protein YhjQ/BcsQ [Bryobacteraceae bacterium]|nr:cellulose synthase operon protein YhjQ/BcsQ [Bryobacteraceae bacterium]